MGKWRDANCEVCGVAFNARVRTGYVQRFCSRKCNAKHCPPPRAIVLPLAERFASYQVRDEATGCWEWQGARTPMGYGNFTRDGRRREGRRSEAAHRVSWELHRGPIPKGLFVLHACDNPRCVNPAHLRLGTHIENMDDMVRRRRHLAGRKAFAEKVRGENNPNSKLTVAAVLDIRANRESAASAAARYGVNAGRVRDLRKGKGWTWLTG